MTSLYKADARISSNDPGTNSGTFKLTMYSVNYGSGSEAQIVVDNIDPQVSSETLNTDIINAVKAYWSLGLLDLVRVL